MFGICFAKPYTDGSIIFLFHHIINHASVLLQQFFGAIGVGAAVSRDVVAVIERADADNGYAGLY